MLVNKMGKSAICKFYNGLHKVLGDLMRFNHLWLQEDLISYSYIKM